MVVHYCARKTITIVEYFELLYNFHAVTLQLFRIHFNIILPSTYSEFLWLVKKFLTLMETSSPFSSSQNLTILRYSDVF